MLKGTGAAIAGVHEERPIRLWRLRLFASTCPSPRSLKDYRRFVDGFVDARGPDCRWDGPKGTVKSYSFARNNCQVSAVCAEASFNQDSFGA